MPGIFALSCGILKMLELKRKKSVLGHGAKYGSVDAIEHLLFLGGFPCILLQKAVIFCLCSRMGQNFTDFVQ